MIDARAAVIAARSRYTIVSPTVECMDRVQDRRAAVIEAQQRKQERAIKQRRLQMADGGYHDSSSSLRLADFLSPL